MVSLLFVHCASTYINLYASVLEVGLGDIKEVLGKLEQLLGKLVLKGFMEYFVRYANSVICGDFVDMIVFRNIFFLPALLFCLLLSRLCFVLVASICFSVYVMQQLSMLFT